MLPRTISIFLLLIYQVFIGKVFAQDTTNLSQLIKQFQEMTLEELMEVKVVTASKKQERIDDTPNVMYVFKKEMIRKRGYTNLSDLFASSPGLFAFGYNGIQKVGQVRGIAPNDNEKVTVMINGHPINNLYEPDYFNGALRLDQFERVEIIVGPGSVLYGAQTLCATVNLITPDNKSDQSKSTFQLSTGNYGQYMGSMTFEKNRKDDDHFYFTANVTSKNGYDAFPVNASDAGNRGLAGTNVVDKLYPSVVMLANGNIGNWGMQFFSQNSQMAEVHQHKGAAEDGRRYDYIYSMLIQNHIFLTTNLTFNFKAYGDLKRHVRTSYIVGSGSGNQPNWDIFGSEYGVESSIIHQSSKNYFQAGIQSHIHQHRHNYEYLWYPDNPSRSLMADDSSTPSYMRLIIKQVETYNIGFYISDDFRVNDKLKLVAAIRGDYSTIFMQNKPYFSPRIACVYNPFEQFTLKVMYNMATRMPPPIGTHLNMLWGRDKAGLPFAEDWAIVNYNADKPEQLSAYEFQSIYYVGKFRFAFNAYYQQLTDFFAWYNPRTNVGDFSGYGVEISVDAKINQRLSLWGNYAFAKNEFTASPSIYPFIGSDGIETPKTYANPQGESVGAPKHSANLGFDLNLIDNISVSVYSNYFAGQPMFYENSWGYSSMAFLSGALNWVKIMDTNFDTRLVCRNITNNRNLMSTQWLNDVYRPRGINFEWSVIYQFNK